MLEGKSVVVEPDGTQVAAFSYDFNLDGKALETTVDEHGDLYIEGYASDYDVDRQEEAFEPGAFDRGLKAYLDMNPILLYHHKYDHALGQVEEARIDEKGLFVKARIDNPTSGSWAEDIYAKIKRGTIKAFSVGGIFKRRMTEKGPRIYDVDLGEISVTPFPVNPRTTFSVIAGKAFADAPTLEDTPELAETRPGTPVLTETSETEEAERVLTASEEGEQVARPESEEDRIAREAAEKEEAERLAAEEAAAKEAAAQQDAAEMQALVAALDNFGERLEAIANRWAKPSDDESAASEETETTEEDEPKAE